MRINSFVLRRSISILINRKYATGEHRCDAHMNELPVPCGPWDPWYKKKQSYYNRVMVFGTLCSPTARYCFRWHGPREIKNRPAGVHMNHFGDQRLRRFCSMFANKVVLITGSGTGIGAVTAVEFAKQGAKLVLTGRNKENLDDVAKKCLENSTCCLQPLIILADMTKENDVENIIKTTIDNFGQLDVLVNNAGILESGTIESTSLAQYDRVMNTNVRGPYHLTMLAMPHLIKTKGNIVNVSSVTGLRSFPNVLAYCMSKSALDQFTRCVALEVGLKGVRVNAVNPGVIVTGLHKKGEGSMNDKQYEDFLKKSAETHAIGRPGEAIEVASVITFLASDAASNITGATLPVDGGRHAMCPR